MAISTIVKRLRQAGHKVTPQRLAIIRLVAASREHLTPSDVYERLRHQCPDIGEATVYRTLNILSELALVCVVHVGNNEHGYVSRPEGHHDHLICSECGKVIDFTGCNLPELEKRLMSENNFKIKGHRLDFYGRCRECCRG
jgi:Fur family transcriptional regulator, ferric uptake regulator